MNRKFLALALSGALTLTLLAGCAKPATEETPAPSTTPTETVRPTEPVQPTEPPVPTETVPPTETAKPSESAKPSPKPSESAKPSPKPTTPPSVKPEAPKPTPSAKPETSKVQSVWNDISKLELPSLMDIDDAVLTDLYGIDPADLTEYVGKMPMMSAHVTEVLIAKVASGKMDGVKQACLDRQASLAGGGQYPSNTVFVDGYKLVVNGDYIIFCIDEFADDMVAAFNSYTK